MSDPHRHDRIALNESRFRDINDRVRSDMDQLRRTPERIRFVCECGNLDCREQVELTVAEYERVRSESRDFAIVPGHEIPDAEDVIERADGYFVVRKHPDVAPLVEALDPRR